MKFPPRPNYAPNPQINKVIKEKAERKEMAIAAMQGYAANQNSWKEYDPEDIARLAVRTADALIAELNKPTNDKP